MSKMNNTKTNKETNNCNPCKGCKNCNIKCMNPQSPCYLLACGEMPGTGYRL